MILNNFTSEQSDSLAQLATSLSQQQKIWLSGYFAGLSESAKPENVLENPILAGDDTTALTILYGSRTGNGDGLAKKAAQLASEFGYKVSLKNMAEYKTRDLQNEQNLLVIVSTHGEGVPPISAKELYAFIHGKRAPKLDKLNYAVIALGDSSYFHFCKTGIDFDNQLEKLGAKQLTKLATLDVDFAVSADKWLGETLPLFGRKREVKPVKNLKYKYLGGVIKAANASITKSNPLNAPVLEKFGLHGRNSNRQTIHLELSTENNPGLVFQPGDAAGVIPINTTELVGEVLKITHLDGEAVVAINGDEKPLKDALQRSFELSKITVDVIKRYLETYPNEALARLSTDSEKLKSYIDGRDIVDLFTDYPVEISAENLVKILRPLQPRYYSIASSPAAFPGEIHLTVGVVQYHQAGRDKKGTCSNYLSDVLIDNETVPLFIEPNPGFRLPEKAETPIIMVGAGTGIAPYRAFIQHRELSDNSGKSWLFFGNRNFESEFLYQTEWQGFLKSGALTKMDVAFSRDGDTKVYVQDRLWENGAAIFDWLEEGAHLYICGDMKKMARAVQDTLLRIVEKYGVRSIEQAEEYIDNLEKSKRLQLDVY